MEKLPQEHIHESKNVDEKKHIEHERVLMSVLRRAEQTLTQLSSAADHGDLVSSDALKLALAQVRYVHEQVQVLEDELTVAEKDARIDHLTGLPNKRAFEEELQRAYRHITDSTNSVERRAEHTPKTAHVVGVDIDGFKNINDTYGHDIGDKYLIAIAKELRETIARSGDVIARTGGDEFSALLLDTDTLGVTVVADRIAVAVETASNNARTELTHVRGTIAPDKGNVSASIGFAMLDSSKDTPADVLQRADYALYVVKAAGKRGVLSDIDASEYDHNGEMRKQFFSQYKNGTD